MILRPSDNTAREGDEVFFTPLPLSIADFNSMNSNYILSKRSILMKLSAFNQLEESVTDQLSISWSNKKVIGQLGCSV